MSTKQYHEIAVGWLKEGPRGQYISAINGERQKLKLLVQDESGNVSTLNSFAVFFKDGEKKNPKAPDVSFVFTTES